MLCREALRAGNAATVLATLVPQARAIFGILAAAQLAAAAEAGGEPGKRAEPLMHAPCTAHPTRFTAAAVQPG